MAWARFEATMPRHPKVVGLSVHAKWAFVEAICWSVEQSTDGHIPSTVPLKTFTANRKPDAVMNELVDAGLLEMTTTGLLIHDFDDYQLSGAQDKAKKEAARLRKRRQRDREHGVTGP